MCVCVCVCVCIGTLDTYEFRDIFLVDWMPTVYLGWSLLSYFTHWY